MQEKKIRSVVPIYLAGAAWILAGFVPPLYRLWALGAGAAFSLLVFLIARKIFPGTVVMVPGKPEPEKKFATGDTALDETLTKARADLVVLQQLDDFIEDEPLSECIRRMVKAGEGILREVAERPEKSKQIRKFGSYYLPTSIKILTAYARMERGGFRGENAAEIQREVQVNAETIAKAFEAQLDNLFASETLDITTDIEVLKNMLKSDDLTQYRTVKRRT